MATLSEMIWQRGSARKIMRETRKWFRTNAIEDLPSAYIALASAHYSLVKRYVNRWWKKPLAVWHVWRAAWNVNIALAVAGGNTSRFGVDQIDVITTILAKAPSWLGGDCVCALSLLNSALYLNVPAGDTMKPHTRALMLITLGDLEWNVGNSELARRHYDEARKLISAIEIEGSPDRELQLIRVLKKVGFFYFDDSYESDRYFGEKLLTRALELAREFSKDQTEEILAEWKKRRGF